MTINIYAPIIPLKELGGFVLGASEDVLINSCDPCLIDRNFDGETKYIYADRAIVAAVSWETKKFSG